MKEISFFMKCVFLCRIYPLVVALDYSLLEKVSRVSRVSREEKRFILCKKICQKIDFCFHFAIGKRSDPSISRNWDLNSFKWCLFVVFNSIEKTVCKKCVCNCFNFLRKTYDLIRSELLPLLFYFYILSNESHLYLF